MNLFTKTIVIMGIFNAVLFITAIISGHMLLLLVLIIFLELICGIGLSWGKTKIVGQGMLLVVSVSFLIGTSICSKFGSIG